ncbi:MAG: suppressor of fused domain protein [Lachnospiraceae bacterium]|nr:suppressor of fused domain protein [Lachnospiraceae bacterium]
MGLFDKLKEKMGKKATMDDMYLYSEKELDEYEAFIQENFGPFEKVLHEIVSPDIHLDIIIVPPTAEDNYYKLITMGMGAYSMNVPKDLKEYELEHAELVLYLPKYWNIESPDEKDYWPIRYLKILGRLPIEYDTWLGYGHTVHGNEEKEPFAENTELNSLLLVNACNLLYENLDLRLSSGKKINFYQLFPLYQEELEYKMEHSMEELLELFSDEDIVPILNIKRKNYCVS